ncbi:Universal stress protein family (plasmid) [Rubrobacter radiotolerans]|uniref:Universal stress protein n=1 Tax=Rubrobacter radiotolerans TaxID=42256 RepID=A0A023X832_RUBRA|nr:universal stress protein [Rubrobacter radiotolerans]AHY48229.1 Universal stress protein family [Rubrobacter radiotolerans]MDX5895264.1 universal stress protein [Rubrobacter radiotolerans]SMC01922.1 Nucleotide-binding universal stress protein, UspA family [Rubrobacter radiotolerans DSM 5868]
MTEREPDEGKPEKTELRRILLATDGSEDARLATVAAVDLANRSGAKLHLVHVFEFIPPREFVSLALRVRSPFASQKEGERTIEEAVSLVREVGGRVQEAHLRMGSPPDGVLSVAGKIGADLIVIGSRGLGGVKRLLMGSVSERVVQHASCPVLVLRDGEDLWPPARIIVADDGSEHALRAGRLGALVGGLYGARAMLAQVYPRALESERSSGSPGAKIVAAELGRAEERLLERARILEPALKRHLGVRLLPDRGSETIDGIATTLLEAAREAGESTLLALGSRGLGPLERVSMGSVSTKVVRAAPGPVLVCPGAGASEWKTQNRDSRKEARTSLAPGRLPASDRAKVRTGEGTG